MSRAVLQSVIRNPRALGIGVLGGREDRGQGYGPIRHGALSAMDSASAQAISLRAGVVHGAHASSNAARCWLQGLCGCVEVVPGGERPQLELQLGPPERAGPSGDAHSTTARRKRASCHHSPRAKLRAAERAAPKAVRRCPAQTSRLGRKRMSPSIAGAPVHLHTWSSAHLCT
jgi:hypothetical protein